MSAELRASRPTSAEHSRAERSSAGASSAGPSSAGASSAGPSSAGPPSAGFASAGPSSAAQPSTSTDAPPSVRITEIFHSVQGESTWAGLPCTFVRLTGCPLRCVWCDTAYAFHGGERRSLDEILAVVEGFGTRLVEITGGEPLVQRHAFTLAERLLDAGYTVLVETSGAVDVSPLDPRAHKIMDLKCPGSGEDARNLWSNLEHLTARDEIKFVIADRADWEWTERVIRERGLDQRVRDGGLRALLVSPVWKGVDLEAFAGWILASGLPVRMQIQLHKLIWGPDKKGV